MARSRRMDRAASHRRLTCAAALACFSLSCFSAGESASSSTSSSSPPTSWPPRTDLLPYLANISEWAVAIGVATNNISKSAAFVPGSIFINGNLARVLLSAGRLTGNATYTDAALQWCDTLCAIQKDVQTSTGLDGGWWDTGYGDLFLADTGTAVSALTLCLKEIHSRRSAVADDSASTDAPPRAETYATTLAKFTRLVTQGCVASPNATKYGPGCPPSGRGWVHTEGDGFPSEWAGSLGDGWYMKKLNMSPYTIATATAGSCFFPLLYSANLTDNGCPGSSQAQQQETLLAYALAAGRWIVGNRTANGTIPYVITPPDTAPHLFQCISYSAESFVILDLLFRESSRPFLTNLSTTIELLVTLQNPDGSWGPLDSGEGERSPRAATLLQWWWSEVDSSNPPGVKAAIDKYVSYVIGNWDTYRVNVDALVTGFVGLAFADLIQPWSTFGM